jgi:hypothetical protein
MATVGEAIALSTMAEEVITAGPAALPTVQDLAERSRLTAPQSIPPLPFPMLVVHVPL